MVHGLFKGRRNFIAYRTVTISFHASLRFFLIRGTRTTDCRDFLWRGNLNKRPEHAPVFRQPPSIHFISIRKTVFSRPELLPRETRETSDQKRSIRKETQLSTVESGTPRGVATTKAPARGIYFLVARMEPLRYCYSATIVRCIRVTGRRIFIWEKFSENRKTTGARNIEGRNAIRRWTSRRKRRGATDRRWWKKDEGRERKRDSRGREFGVMKEKEGEKKEQQIDRCQREAQRDGESSLPKKSSVLLRSDSSLRAPSIFIPFAPTTKHTFSLVLLVVHLEARQMSGIRLRHLSVSPFVTFDSRQIDEREKGTKTDFLSWLRRRWPANVTTYRAPTIMAVRSFCFFSFATLPFRDPRLRFRVLIT